MNFVIWCCRVGLKIEEKKDCNQFIIDRIGGKYFIIELFFLKVNDGGFFKV